MALAGTLEIQLIAGIARLQRDMDQAGRVVNNATASMSRAADAAKSALAGIGMGIGLAQIVQMSDAYAKFTAQLRLASTSAREYAAAYGDVKRIATAAQQDLQATGMLYARIANGTRELGTTQKQVAAITETVNMALRVSGATAAESASAQLQLSQAFASGTLRGEEFNAVNEAAPRLMLALADGIGVPVGALKKMAENGEITSKIMADVLPRALEKLREEAKEVQTISGAFTVLKGNLMEFVGIQANANGGVAALTGAIGLLASNLAVIGTAMVALTAIKLAVWMEALTAKTLAASAASTAQRAATVAAAQAAVASAQATVASTAAEVSNLQARAAMIVELRAETLATIASANAVINSTASDAAKTLALQSRSVAMIEVAALGRAGIAVEASLATATAASTAATTAAAVATTGLTATTWGAVIATRALGAAMWVVANPLTALTAAIGIGATAWMVWENRTKESNDKALTSVDETTTEMISRLDKQIEKLKERNRLQDTEPRLKSITDLSDADKDGLARAKKALDEVRSGSGSFAGQSASMRQLAEIDLAHNYETALLRIGQAQDEVTAAAKRTEGARLADWFGRNGTAAQRMAHELEETRKKVGTLTPEMEKLIRAKYIDKGAAKVITQEATAYQNLVTSIGEKIAANKLEMSGYDKLSDAQKMTIKLDELIASGKNKLTPKHIEETRALIATVAAQDQAIERTNAMAKIQAEYAENIGKSVESAIKEADKNEELARTFGLTKSAVEALEIARMEDRLERLRGIDMADDEVAALELVIAAKKRSAAAATTLDQMEIAKKAADDAMAAWKKAADSIENSLTDALMRGFESGKSFGRNLMDTLKNMFKTLILRPTIQGILAPVAGTLAGSMIPVAAQAGVSSGVGSAVGSSLGIGGTLASIGTGAMQTAGAILSGQIGLGSTLSAGLSAIGTGTASGMAAGFSSVIGALGPIALGIAAAVAIWKKLDTSGTFHTGGASFASSAGVSTIRAESLGFEATRTNADTEKMTAGLVTGIVSILDSTALAFGKAAGYTAATAFADDTSKDGAWGALVIDKLGAKIVDWQDTKTGSWAPKEFADGAAGQTEYLAALSASVRTALDDIGLPSWAQGMLDGLADGASLDDMAKVVDSINATKRALVVMGERLAGFANLSDGAASALIKASGGIDALVANASSYHENFYTESEKTASVTKQVTDALAAVNVAMPTTREGYRAEIEARLALGEAGAPAVAAMLRLNGAFASFTPVAESAATAVRSLADILGEAASLQDQLDSLTMSPTALAAKARGKIDPSNLKLYDDVQIAQGVVDLAAANKVYLDQIREMDRATMTSAQLRADDIIGMDESTIKLYDLVMARKADQAATAAHATLMESNRARADAIYTKRQADGQAAEQAAASQAQALMTQRAGMEATLFNLTHTSAEQLARARELELAGMNATLRPLQSQIYAMQDQASAAAMAATALENAAASARAVASERGGLQREMYQLTGNTIALRKMEVAALAPENRALKESIFAMQDKIAAEQAAAAAAQAAAQAALQAAEEQKRAAEQHKNAMQGVTDTIFAEVDRLRGLISGDGAQSLASAWAKFTVTNAMARGGDEDAYKLLPQLSQAVDRLAEANAITEFDLRLSRAQLASAMSMTATGIGRQFGLSVPSYDVGTDYVPRTGLALIHEGERITPAAYNNPYTRGQGGDTSRLEAAVERLTAEVAELRRTNSLENYAIAKNTGETASQLDDAINGERPILVEVSA